MSSQTPVIKLVKSLSSAEKRHFKLHSRKQSGEKDYLDLFDLIDEMEVPDMLSIRERFQKLHPKSTLDNASRYLLKVLTDCLIQSKMDKDVLFQSLHGIMRVRVLQERSLPKEGYKLLKKIRESASNAQQHFIEYITYRYELNYLSDLGFSNLSDDALVQTQMKARRVLKTVASIQDHYSLFETLKYRVIHSGQVLSDEERKRLTDLLLSELVLVADKTKNSFTAQKLHLLFQSFFFTNTGDYQSALKVFYELNTLFENNQHILDNPPLDYLSSLNGILDSLHVLGNFDEINFYIDKLKNLDKQDYPEHFRYLVRKTEAIYRLVILVGKNKFKTAKDYIESLESGLLSSYSMVNEEKQWELYFYCSLTYFCNNDLKKAHVFIRELMWDNKPHYQLLICKAIRLLNIIIHYEKGDRDYLEYEIRSYKRFFQQHGKLLKSEILFLKIVEHSFNYKSKLSVNSRYKKLLNELAALSEDRYEKQLLKYFNFVDWAFKKAN